MGRSLSGRLSSQTGASQLGCLLRLALVVLVIWIGFKVADPYIKNWQLEDEMGQAARFAQTLSDSEIRRRIIAEVRKLNLPQEAERIRIERRPGREIVIWTEYTVTLSFPKFEREITFHPTARASL